MAFEYKSDNGVTLTPSQTEFLEAIENIGSPFKGVKSLTDLRILTGLSVVVADRVSLCEILLKAKEATYRKILEDHRTFNLARKDIDDRFEWIEKMLSYNTNEGPRILGLYSRKLFWFDGYKPIVYLFADNIEDYARIKGFDEKNVFGFVFIHEMMHAYYDSFNSAGFPAKEPLEEAFAEYGMLTFINKTIGPGVFLEEAKASVFSKIDDGPKEYGFGYELFADTSGGAPEMIERYRLVSNWIDYPIVSRFAKDYFKCIEDYKKSTDEKTASDCIEGIQYILEHEWPEPDEKFSVQPGIGKRVTSGSFVKSLSMAPSAGSTGSKNSTTGTLSADRFWIFDLASRKLVGTTSVVARVPLMVIKALLRKNPTLSFDDLDRLFNPVHNHHLPTSLGVVSKEKDVRLYYHATYTSKGKKIKSRFYDNDPIRLATGDVVLVTNQWSLKKYEDDFEEFLYIVQARSGFFVYDSMSK